LAADESHGGIGVRIKDPTEWMDDLTVYMDDESVTEAAASMEPTILHGGSRASAGACVALTGIVAGAFGGATLSPDIRSSAYVFGGYLIAGLVLVRSLHPLTVRLMGRAVAWHAGLAFVFALVLGTFPVMAARIGSPTLAYLVSFGLAAMTGLVYGSFRLDVIRREDLWMLAALPLAPVSTLLATYYLRSMPLTAGSVSSTAMAGAIAGGLFMIPMGSLLAHLWDEAHGLGQMGLLFLHNDNFAPKAVAYLDRAIALAPRNAQLYNLRGIAWSKMDEPERASADWRKAAELAPNDLEPHLNRGMDFLRQGALDQAIESLQTALAVDPDEPKAHSNLGVAYERRGDLDRAIDHYDRAIAKLPDYANAHSNRGYAYFLKGHHHRALEDCDRAIALEPGLCMAHVNRGHVLAALGRTQDAEVSYRTTLDLGPEPSIEEEALRGLEVLGAEGSGGDPE
jgi:Flp pilus assembly protein TadD